MNIQSLLNKTELIYIDTSVLMNPLHLYRFINRYKDMFTDCGKKIIVSNTVYQELLRLANSNNEEKANKARTGLRLIYGYSDLFSLERSAGEPEDLDHAFADPELLTRLTQERRFKRQLLITNDRDLSQDAYDLNTTHSFRGKEIYVYYVNYGGYLTPSSFDKTISIDLEPQTQTIICDTNTPSNSNLVAEEDSDLIYKYIGISALSFALGVGATLLGISIASSKKAS